MENSKQAIAEQEEKDLRRYQKAWRFFRTVLAPFIRLAYNYHHDSLKDMEGPYLLLANHNLDFDPLLIGMLAFHHIYFVATENVLRMGLLGWIVKRFCAIIVHYKGVAGTGTVRQVLGCLRKGHSVALFPEGNRSFSGVTGGFSPATGKMARAAGVSLVTVRISGGFLTTPRWGKGIRRGRMEGHVAHIYTHEQLKAMTDDEINAAIAQDLYVDAYADQQRHPVAFRRLCRAKGLASMLFRCPDCGAIGTLTAKGNTIACTCGYRARYDVYGYLCRPDGRREPLSRLYAAQKAYVITLTERDPGEKLFSDTVTLQVIRPDHTEAERREAVLTAYPDRFTLDGEVIPFSELFGIAINQRNRLMLHVRGREDHYECTGGYDFSALKYLYLIKQDMQL